MYLSSNQAGHSGWRGAGARDLLARDRLASCFLFLASCLLASVWSESAAAHPFHISTAEVEYDGASQRLQVSLKMQAVDLEQALARQVGRRVNIEHADSREQLIHFLNRSFYLSSDDLSSQPAGQPGEQADKQPDAVETVAKEPGKRRSRARWVGQELKGAWLWLYFELELPDSPGPLWLVNSVLFDVNEQQINTVSVRHGTQRTTLKMTPIQPSAKFESKWMHRD